MQSDRPVVAKGCDFACEQSGRALGARTQRKRAIKTKIDRVARERTLDSHSSTQKRASSECVAKRR
jgi:hypothetical protein